MTPQKAFTILLSFPFISAFLLQPVPIARRTFHASPFCQKHKLYMTSDQQPQTHRPLKQEEIENSLDVVPLYAITSTENDSILLIDDTDKNIANFYLSREFAEKIASGYNDVKVDVYSLGKIYFQHFDPDAPSIGVKKLTANEKYVEYRLVPDPRELEQARSILFRMAGIDEAFEGEFNEIPLFMDQHVRLATGADENGDDYKEVFPIYFGWNDLVDTCQEYVRAFADSGEEFEAAISVSDLTQLIAQMKQKSPVDFREVAFMPASPRPFDS